MLRPISETYAAIFLDDMRYAGHPQQQLEGLAAVVEDTDSMWRPPISEVVRLLPPSDSSNRLLVAGSAYGCAKVIRSQFPGPAILLYGAALNAIGSAPNTELQEAIEFAKKALDDTGLSNNEYIKLMIKAAKERAQFDKVSQMLRDEFTSGMKVSGQFDQAQIPQLAQEIVAVTHDVRHKGLIERVWWQHKTREIGGSDSDLGYLEYLDEIEFKDDRLRKILLPAQMGCAYSIKRRLDERRAA